MSAAAARTLKSRPIKPRSRYQQGIFDVEVVTDDVDALLQGIYNAVSNFGLTAFLEGPASAYIKQTIVDRFNNEGDRKVGKWLPLAPATQEVRRSRGIPAEHPINIRSGDMARWLTDTSQYDVITGDGWGALNAPGPGNSELERKLLTAQEGRDPNPNPKYGPTPPRPVLAFETDDAAVILQLLEINMIASVVAAL